MRTRFLKLFAVIFALSMAAILFAGCNKADPKRPENAIVIAVSGSETQTVRFKQYTDYELVEDETYTMSQKHEFLGQILDELNGLEVFPLIFTGTANDMYGRLFTGIGDIIPADGTDEFLTIFSTVDDIRYSFFETTAVVDKITYYMANYGADQMPIVSGAGYCIFVDIYIP